MSVLDWLVIIILYAGIFVAGIFWQRRPSGVDGHEHTKAVLSWKTLGLSAGMSGYDAVLLTWMTGLFYTLGVRALWLITLSGLLYPALFMVTGSWVRRSKCVSLSEWLDRRFGLRRDGLYASGVYKVYASLACLLIGAIAIRELLVLGRAFHPEGGMVFGGVLMLAAVVCVIWGGVNAARRVSALLALLFTIAAACLLLVVRQYAIGSEILTNAPAGWTDILPGWDVAFVNPAHPGAPGYLPQFEAYGLSCLIVIITSILLSAGGLFHPVLFECLLHARSEKDAARMGAAAGLMMVPRLVLALGIAILARASGLAAASPAAILPVVLENYLPDGLRGIAIAGIFSAFVTAFMGALGYAASIQAPVSGSFKFPMKAYLPAIAYLVAASALGVVMARSSLSLDWLIPESLPAFALPLLLPWIAWRFNGWGMVAGLGTSLLAIAWRKWFASEWPFWASLPVLFLLPGAAGLVTSKLTRGTEVTLLKMFYFRARPAGFWWPVQREVLSENPKFRRNPPLLVESANLILACAFFIFLSLAGMVWMLHQNTKALLFLGAALAVFAGLAITWKRTLPKD